MKADIKLSFILKWGFQRQQFGAKYYRDLYKAEGYREFWDPAEPDVIAFYVEGEWSHEYPIDWNLFN